MSPPAQVESNAHFLSFQGGTGVHMKRDVKTSGNRKRKPSVNDEADGDEASRDWWTKYFASVEAMIEVGQTYALYAVSK